MKRSPSTFNPDHSLPDVLPNDIADKTIEDRHINLDEIDAKHVSVNDDAIGTIQVTFEKEVDADGSAGLAFFGVGGAPFKFEVMDVRVRSKVASGGGTAIIRSTTNVISDAIIMAVDNTISRASTIDKANSVISAGADLNVITNGAADRGVVTVIGIKRA